MLKIFGNIYVICTGNSLDKLIASTAIPNFEIVQVGSKRNIPDNNRWQYSSPWYELNSLELNKDILNILIKHKDLRDVLKTIRSEIEYAIFCIVPVNQNEEMYFSHLFDLDVISKLNDIGLELEIAPCNVMPNVTIKWR